MTRSTLSASPVSVGNRLGYGCIDLVVLAGIWLLVLNSTSVRFPYGVMQSFVQADYDAYVVLMSRLALALFALSVIMHLLVGGSLGKWVLSVRTVDAATGQRPSPLRVVLRSGVMFLLGLMILAPGPIAAFIFGKGSEALSFTLLLIGVGIGLLVTVGWQGRPSLLERQLHLVTTRQSKNLPT